MFVFGSAARGAADPKDLDVLFVYERALVPPENAHAAVRPIREALARRVHPLPLHSMMLSEDEEAAEDFIARHGGIPLADWLETRAEPGRSSP